MGGWLWVVVVTGQLSVVPCPLSFVPGNQQRATSNPQLAYKQEDAKCDTFIEKCRIS